MCILLLSNSPGMEQGVSVSPGARGPGNQSGKKEMKGIIKTGKETELEAAFFFIYSFVDAFPKIPKSWLLQRYSQS